VCENSTVRTPRLLPAALLALALGATACGTGETDTASDTTTVSPVPGLSPGTEPGPTAAPAETSDAEAGARFDGDLADKSSAGSGIGLSVVDVRVGEHDGYDRVVFELGGNGTVGWRVGYDDDPRRQGSGDEVELEGDATLAVVLEGVGYPFDTGVEEYGGPRQLSPGQPSVREVAIGGVFEGYFDAFVGVEERRPFRVTRLDGPLRVVVDIAHTA